MREDMIRLTKAMIRIPSVNTTEGERKIGEFIEAYIKDIPYFIQNASHRRSQSYHNRFSYDDYTGYDFRNPDGIHEDE